MVAIAYNAAVSLHPAHETSVQFQHPVPRPGQHHHNSSETYHIISIRPGLVEAMRCLDTFAKYYPDWDDTGAAIIARDTILRAKSLVRNILVHDSPGGMEPFYIGPIPNGGIQIEWRGPTHGVEIEIRPDRTYGYLLTEIGTNEPEITYHRSVSFHEAIELVSKVLDA